MLSHSGFGYWNLWVCIDQPTEPLQVAAYQEQMVLIGKPLDWDKEINNHVCNIKESVEKLESIEGTDSVPGNRRAATSPP
jgi:hypothetical protein